MNEHTGTTGTGQPGEVPPDPYAAFWDQRDILKHIHAYAQATYVGPWAMLGVVLARAIAATDPTLMLYEMIRSRASLNLFVALCGRSGGGKGLAERGGRDAVLFDNGGTPVDIEEHSPGSGEGIARLFAEPAVKEEDRPALRRALLTSSEVDTLIALGSRQGSTLMGELRKVYSGEALGFANANRATRTRVQRDSYRACLLLGVQYLRAGALLDDAAGGTPQRFLYLPTTDDYPPEFDPDAVPPDPITVSVPARSSVGPKYMRTPREMNDEFRRYHHARRCGEPVDEFDGHKMLTRAKVAAALAILDGREHVNLDDWKLAGTVIRVSDRTRAEMVAAVAEQARKAARARAEVKATEAVTVDDARHGGEVQRVREGLLRYLERRGKSSARDLAKSIKFDIRGHVDLVLADLVNDRILIETGDDKRKFYELANAQ
ncbi:hypothetical protein GV791_01780 [Nocardia cyriacigeorgica]|uniref:DUF3987 domain-containing protein n=1 Tax=Nocardia cyriacigeorgica TaxID=135487 RepID=A0A6P1CFB5_9NOCA|nr:hypothetical protein [Nocardia cyriacigeorgica]MBF6288151.1 hypothetical protein [Nocardia cyriacigeorgica]NEW31290.1 hypothetical protein [Nocardia cyriacigeorgica]